MEEEEDGRGKRTESEPMDKQRAVAEQ
jgi:hypothetical protein